MEFFTRSVSHSLIILCLFGGIAQGDTVPIIHNENLPLQGNREITLETLWQVGASEDDPCAF